MPIIQLKTQHEHVKKRAQSVVGQPKNVGGLQGQNNATSIQVSQSQHHPFGVMQKVQPSTKNQFIGGGSGKQQPQIYFPVNSGGIIGSGNNANNNNFNSINSNRQSVNPQEIQQKEGVKKVEKQKQSPTNNLNPPKKVQQKPQNQQKQKRQQKPLKVQIIKHPSLTDQQSKPPQTTQPQPHNDSPKKKKKKKKPAPQQPDLTSLPERIAHTTLQLYSLLVDRHHIPFTKEYPQLMTLLKESYAPFAEKEVEEEIRESAEGDSESTGSMMVRVYNLQLFDLLNKRKRVREDRIYLGVLEQNTLFNDLIWRQQITSEPKKHQVSLLFNSINTMMINDIYDGEYQIKPKEKASKDQIIYGSYKANQIRMAESIIKEKLSNLNEELFVGGQDNEDGEHQSENVEGNGGGKDDGSIKFNHYKKYDINSEETKKAEEFVKRLQQDEKLLKQRARKLKQLQEQAEINRLQSQQQQKRQQHQQKVQQRKIYLLQKAQQRQLQKRHRQQQQKQYQEYLSQHRQRTPLFKKKEEDFKAFMVKEHLKKLEMMKEIQKSKRSVSKEEIEIHQAKYRQLKDLMEQQRLQLQKLQHQQAQDRNDTSFYKSRFHQSIMSETDRLTLQQQKKSKAEQLYTKKIEYATIVKTRFMPKIDVRKKEELEGLIRGMEVRVRGDREVAERTRMEGERNLEKLHRLVGEMRAKGRLKKTSTAENSGLSSSVDPPSNPLSSRYINYLSHSNNNNPSSLRNSSSLTRKSRFTSLDTSSLNRNSLNMIELQAMNLQQQADRKSLFLKNTKTLDMEEYLERKFELEDDYVESARAKVKVLERYEMGGD